MRLIITPNSYITMNLSHIHALYYFGFLYELYVLIGFYSSNSYSYKVLSSNVHYMYTENIKLYNLRTIFRKNSEAKFHHLLSSYTL